MRYLCIYHKDCADGFGAALAVKQYCEVHSYDCDFVSAYHGDDAPDVTGKHVFIVDFSYPREVLIEMETKAESLVLIDHHKSAQEALCGLDFCVFDMSKSGAVLTWQHLLPDRRLPALLSYIQDRDLWHWQLPDSKQISAALETVNKDFDKWERYLTDSNLSELISKGAVIVEYQNKLIEKVSGSKDIPVVDIAGYLVPCINTTHFISEIGNVLCQGHPFAAMYTESADKRIYSLRSAADGIDVSEIARLFGGGGHFHAAGFAVAKPEVTLSLKTS